MNSHEVSMNTYGILLNLVSVNPSMKKTGFLSACVAAAILFFTAYSGHFNNAFQFDDSHTIKENIWITDLSNVSRFFSDATTTSTLPANQAWRPGLTTLNAIDYAIASKEAPEPFWFHVHIFVGVFLSGIMLFFLLNHILTKCNPERTWNHWLALFGATWFLVHTANAETINYIIARSDTASTFWVLCAFCMYIFIPKTRKFALYSVPMIIGFLIKEPALMFVPLLFVYEWMFGTLNRKFTLNIAVLGCIAIVLFMISRSLTPEAWDPGGVNRWHYLITQPFVIFHYIANFVLPVNLAVDTDWKPITSVFDDRVFFGLVMLIALVVLILRSRRNEKTKAVAFGISWFLIALIPTSSIIPLAEVMNDHRVYFPYIGLIIASVTGFGLLLDRFTANSANNKYLKFQRATIAAMVLLLGLHAAGTTKRCAVWKTEFSLWQDCARKCPGNGRALMNYGNQLLTIGVEELKAGDSLEANRYFNQADSMYYLSSKAWPDYFNTYVNIGALREWQNRDAEAEANYRKAITLRIEQPDAYCWLADFLVRKERYSEAVPFIKKGLELSPAHQKLNSLNQVITQQVPTKDAVTIARETAEQNPTPENYINLSLVCYNSFDFAGTIAASEKAIALRPDYAEAYNNICAANNMLGNYDAAVAAGTRAVAINPSSELFKNNLQEALRQQQAARNQ